MTEHDSTPPPPPTGPPLWPGSEPPPPHVPPPQAPPPQGPLVWPAAAAEPEAPVYWEPPTVVEPEAPEPEPARPEPAHTEPESGGPVAPVSEWQASSTPEPEPRLEPAPGRSLPMSVEEFADKVAAIEAAVGERIVGQQAMVRQAILGLLNEGHVLLEGVPGLGKTEMLKALSEAIDLSFSRLQFTPDLMPADIVGTQVLDDMADGHRSFRFQEGPIFAHLVLADEINRATPKSQSALLEAMQERTATIAGVTHRLPRPFLVMATQNPIELEGTYPLPEAQLDRFLIKINVKPPDRDLLSAILVRSTTARPRAVPRVVGEAELNKMIELATMVPVAGHLVGYIADLVTNTHPSTAAIGAVTKYVRHGASPRGGQAIMKLARTLALIDGRPNVSRDDITWAVVPALGHRLVLNYEATADGVTVEDVLGEVLAGTPEPGPHGRGIES